MSGVGSPGAPDRVDVWRYFDVEVWSDKLDAWTAYELVSVKPGDSLREALKAYSVAYAARTFPPRPGGPEVELRVRFRPTVAA